MGRILWTRSRVLYRTCCNLYRCGKCLKGVGCFLSAVDVVPTPPLKNIPGAAKKSLYLSVPHQERDSKSRTLQINHGDHFVARGSKFRDPLNRVCVRLDYYC